MPSDPRAPEREEQRSGRAGERAERAAERVAHAEMQVERAVERADEQVSRAVERAEQSRTQAEERAARALRKARRASGEDDEEPLIWLREEPHSRRPAYSRERLADAALAIADAEGFEAVSMRRVAQELGAGTMTLYHYVRSKDELITLMVDSVMGEVLVPEDELAAEWRSALAQIAKSTRDAFRRHRWALDRFGDGRPGPNGLRHFEQSLRAVSGLGVDDDGKFELISLIDDYVFGFALREAQEFDEHERGGFSPEVREFFQRELDSGDYPLIRDFLGPDADAAVDRVAANLFREGRFERGLNRLLDGIEAEFAGG
ncbi:MAG: TetR/AcrR family transcriptional regulator [Solirubrobacterales bacterium]